MTLTLKAGVMYAPEDISFIAQFLLSGESKKRPKIKAAKRHIMLEVTPKGEIMIHGLPAGKGIHARGTAEKRSKLDGDGKALSLVKA